MRHHNSSKPRDIQTDFCTRIPTHLESKILQKFNEISSSLLSLLCFMKENSVKSFPSVLSVRILLLRSSAAGHEKNKENIGFLS